MKKTLAILAIAILLTGIVTAIEETEPDPGPTKSANEVLYFSFMTALNGDADGDGIPDADDNCPDQAGPEENCGCPVSGNLDIVFMFDTSGSMNDEGAALCSNIPTVVSAIETQGYTVNYEVMGITQSTPDSDFPCITDSVINYVTNQGQTPVSNQYEDWGPGTQDLANHYQWQPGYTRVIVPLSDECPEDGNSGYCDQADEDSITNAVAAANNNNVKVFPIKCSGQSTCCQGLADDLGTGTGGQALSSTDPGQDLATAITAIITGSIQDRDSDGINDGCDNCPDTPNPDQQDSNGNGVGDACEQNAPVADAGFDQTVNCDETVYFTALTEDGNGDTHGTPESYDPDGSITYYGWDINEDGVDDLTGSNPTAVFTSADTIIVELLVQDDSGLTDTDTMTLTVVCEASCYQGGCDGAVIDVTGDGVSDNQECSNAGYDGAAFHCCGYETCCVPENHACEYEDPIDCVIEYGANSCQVDPTLEADGGDYACCNCYETETGRCEDGVDNDCDGLTDINDTDCQGGSTTTTTTSSTTTTTQCNDCYAPCGDACIFDTVPPSSVDTLSMECPPGSEPTFYECAEECYCDLTTPYDDMWGMNRVTAEGTCKPEIPSPEFSSLAVLLTALLTAPAFAYLLIKKRH